MTTVSQPSTWTEALEMIENNSPHIRKLALTSPWDMGGSVELVSEPDIASFELQFPRIAGHLCPGYSPEYLARLGDAIGSNTHLQILRLCEFEGAAGCPGIADASFLGGVKRNTSIRELELSRINLSDEAVCGMLQSLGEGSSDLTSSINVISLFSCLGGGEGIRAFTTALRRCTNLEELAYTAADDVDVDSGLHFHEIIEAIRYPRRLKKLSTPLIGSAGFEALVPVLQDEGSNLTRLTLDVLTDYENYFDSERVSTVLAKSKALRVINLLERSTAIDSGRRFWSSFARALCDTSTINGTYFSNHTLEWMRYRGPWEGPTENVESILNMNRSSNDKTIVAMMKVVHFHPALDVTPFFKWELKILPIVVDRLEAVRSIKDFPGELVDSRKLRAIYQFIRGMPELVSQRARCTTPADIRLWHVPAASRPASARPADTGSQREKVSKWNLRRILLGCCCRRK